VKIAANGLKTSRSLRGETHPAGSARREPYHRPPSVATLAKK
jgi:hypothetical protein